ncbi:Mitochondrial uncoupling protein 6 [Hibiscus syriacus]|uniref:Mitochondrial uncoupling protein 6 n=1 Tax=Hibiscus syriacus TaxID=106335 RepID=A0A6A3C085_HIBSY|nr:Mitochondrial uncoupling protein 6 [Hibiscus syriacus]
MVRMQADGRLPVSQRRNYTSVVDAITRMSKQEGVTSLWRGSSLTVNRAMLVTASQLASYDQIKETILENGLMKDGLGTHVAASFSAGFVASVASNPVDVIKTRVMNMKVEPGQKPPYAGALDCAIKTVKAEGPMALYKGLYPQSQDRDHLRWCFLLLLNRSGNCSRNFKVLKDDDENEF